MILIEIFRNNMKNQLTDSPRIFNHVISLWISVNNQTQEINYIYYNFINLTVYLDIGGALEQESSEFVCVISTSISQTHDTQNTE